MEVSAKIVHLNKLKLVLEFVGVGEGGGGYKDHVLKMHLLTYMINH